jgi:large subunit ribosomal protein L6
MAMSRIGKRPVEVPQGVTVTRRPGVVVVQGPKGELTQHVPDGVSIAVEKGVARVTAADDLGRRQKAYHGLVRALLANMVRGVTVGYEKRLQIAPLGQYSFRLLGEAIGFKGPFSFDRPFPLPKGVKAELSEKDTVLTLRSADKDLLGRTAADIRRTVTVDRYKGKGVRYMGEQVTLKQRKGAK